MMSRRNSAFFSIGVSLKRIHSIFDDFSSACARQSSRGVKPTTFSNSSTIKTSSFALRSKEAHSLSISFFVTSLIDKSIILLMSLRASTYFSSRSRLALFLFLDDEEEASGPCSGLISEEYTSSLTPSGASVVSSTSGSGIYEVHLKCFVPVLAVLLDPKSPSMMMLNC
ncbi:uncharacterized protein G2W53_010810 [Senna tora]|uniref:Uncharacterized protein n=1 Tax=Senna tora TaxID=362788 RepID=A0A835CBT2_9FABA|nr:uncharacterized protein G2W53_010810 [Senna tora]